MQCHLHETAICQKETALHHDYILIFNLILEFSFLKMCFSLLGAVHFQSVSSTALQKSVLTITRTISARLLNTRGKIKRWITLLCASLLLPDLAKHSFWEKSILQHSGREHHGGLNCSHQGHARTGTQGTRPTSGTVLVEYCGAAEHASITHNIFHIKNSNLIN